MQESGKEINDQILLDKFKEIGVLPNATEDSNR